MMRTFFFLSVLTLSIGVAQASDKLVLSTASAEQLALIDGVDSADAEAIVALRTKRHGLSSVEALRVLPGIDSDTLDALRAHTAVEVSFPVRRTKNQYGNAEEVLTEFAWEPTVQQVQNWANSYAKTSPELVQRWLRASRTFAALPEFTMEYRKYDGWDQGFLYLADINTGEDVATVDDAGRDADRRWTFKARWNLDELVMSSERIRVIQEAQDIVKLRDKVLSEITRLYFERRRVQVEMLLSPKSDMMGQVNQELRLMELTANIDALTGGGFSQAVARAEGASEG